MKILLTGGAGFIGSHIALQLLTQNNEIVIIDDFSNSSIEVINNLKMLSNKNFDFYESNINNIDVLNKIFTTHNIDCVIHLAGFKSVSESTKIPLDYYQNNISGSLILFKIMDKYNVRNFIFSSSASVYGSNNVVPYTEQTSVGSCTNPYATTKYMIEIILKDLYLSNKNWNITVLRYFNPVGANESGLLNEKPNGVPNNLMPYITQVAHGQLPFLQVFGNNFDTVDGTGIRDYIHVEDLANGHILAIYNQKKQSGFHIYNLGTGKPSSVLEMIKAFEEANGIKIPYKICPRRNGDIAISYANITKAKKELNFSPKYDLYQMCKDSFNIK